MKYAKVIGLAAMAVIAAMSFFASAASAKSTPCTNDAKHQGATACAGSHGKHVLVGSVLTASLKAGTNAVLTVTNAEGKAVRTVTCSGSTVSGKITSTLGAGEVTGLTFTTCSSPECEKVTAGAPKTGKSFPWPATASTGTAPNGSLIVTGVSGWFTAVNCLFGLVPHVECEYEAASATVAVTGGAPATVTATAVPLTKVAGPESLCGVKADWSATYTVTTPSSLYLT